MCQAKVIKKCNFDPSRSLQSVRSIPWGSKQHEKKEEFTTTTAEENFYSDMEKSNGRNLVSIYYKRGMNDRHEKNRSSTATQPQNQCVDHFS
jgi:hypothetical protein